MTSTTRALLSAVVVAGVAGGAAGSFVDSESPPPILHRSTRLVEKRPARVHSPAPGASPRAAAPAAHHDTAAAITSADGETRELRRGLVVGLVVDTAGSPIGGATIVEDRDGASGSSVTSDLDGTFKIEVQLNSVLSCRAQGFVAGAAYVSSPAFELRPFVLAHAATLRGIVTHRQRPVAGARVRVARQGRCRVIRQETTTDADGRFEMTGRTEGEDRVSAIVDVNGFPRWCSPTRKILLGEGATVNVELALLEVHEDFAASVRSSSGGFPHGDWKPRLFVLVDGDALIVDERKALWAPVDAPFAVVARHGTLIGRARAAPGQRTVDVTLQPELRLEGRARWPSGAPATSAHVIYRVAEHEGSVEFTDADDEGRFSIIVPRDLGGTLHVRQDHFSVETAVATGATSIVVTLPSTGHVRAHVTPRSEGTRILAVSAAGERLIEDAVAVQVAAGRTKVVARDDVLALQAVAWVDVVPDATVDVQLTLSPPARVRGRVVDPRGRAVRLSLTLADAWSDTDALGHFSFDLVPPGQHTLATTSSLDLVAARFHAKRATLRDRIIDITRPEELDLGDLVVEVE